MNQLKKKYMHMKRLSILSLAAAVCLKFIYKELPAQSRTLPPDEGQAKLMQEVNAGQKSNQLTVKEANKLRKDLAHVAHEKAEMIAKNGGKLNIADTMKLKAEINDINNNIQKLELEKRTQNH